MKEYIVQAIAQETIDSFDAHNAPELVRCKNCTYWHESETKNGYGDCGQANGITLKEENWYCADGEQKERNITHYLHDGIIHGTSATNS